jgi:hypothetical protein
LEGIGVENVIIFNDHLEYFMAIWHNVWQLGIICGHLVYFSHFGMFGPRKIWQPWSAIVARGKKGRIIIKHGLCR